MAVISVAQAKQYASSAGFSGNSLNIIVAIAQAESSLNTQAQNVNSDGSVDRGIVQINARWHPEVSDACAYNPACAFQAAYRISNSGTNFGAWSTYTGGAYLRYLNTSQSTPTGKQWYDYPINQINDYATSYKGAGTDTPHFAVDIEAPMDTPFYFLEPGTIVKADYQAWGGEVFEQPDDKTRPQEYVYHLDQINVKVGQHVSIGQRVGLSGGQTSGGSHPTSPQFSTGPHIHFGEFTKFVDSPNGMIPYGPDPNPLLQAAQGGNVSASSDSGTGTTNNASNSLIAVNAPTPLAQKVNDILSEFPGFAGLAIALDKAEQFPGVIWYNPGSSVQIVPPGSVGTVINQAATAVFDPTDYIGSAIRSVLDTVISNTIPLLVRGTVVGIGLILVGGLIWNALDSSGIVDQVEQLAVKGAMVAA